MQRLTAAAEIETSVWQHGGHPGKIKAKKEKKKKKKVRESGSEGESEFELRGTLVCARMCWASQNRKGVYQQRGRRKGRKTEEG